MKEKDFLSLEDLLAYPSMPATVWAEAGCSVQVRFNPSLPHEQATNPKSQHHHSNLQEPGIRCRVTHSNMRCRYPKQTVIWKIFLLIPAFKKYLCIYFESQNYTEGKRKREREREFPPWVHSSDGHNDQRWARTKREASLTRAQTLKPISTALSSPLAGSWYTTTPEPFYIFKIRFWSKIWSKIKVPTTSWSIHTETNKPQIAEFNMNNLKTLYFSHSCITYIKHQSITTK